MSIPSVIKYVRETCFSFRVTNSQPPTGPNFGGNNRAVINGSTGAIEQTTAYYPYGGIIADLGTPATGQPYRFGGKELIRANGLNEYDFGARQYYSAVPGFTKPDQHCEKYYWLSPYLYCANNPVNFMDPTGMDTWTVDEMGNLINYEVHDKFDKIIVQNANNKEIGNWQGDYGSISKQSTIRCNDEDGDTIFIVDNDENGRGIFEMLARNCGTEWQHLVTGDGVESSINYVSSSRKKGEDSSAFNIIKGQLSADGLLLTVIREAIHSHPGNRMFPSGMKPTDTEGDIFFARWLDGLSRTKVTYKIFTPGNGRYTLFNSNSQEEDFLSTYQGMW